VRARTIAASARRPRRGTHRVGRRARSATALRGRARRAARAPSDRVAEGSRSSGGRGRARHDPRRGAGLGDARRDRASGGSALARAHRRRNSRRALRCRRAPRGPRALGGRAVPARCRHRQPCGHGSPGRDARDHPPVRTGRRRAAAAAGLARAAMARHPPRSPASRRAAASGSGGHRALAAGLGARAAHRVAGARNVVRTVAHRERRERRAQRRQRVVLRGPRAGRHRGARRVDPRPRCEALRDPRRAASWEPQLQHAAVPAGARRASGDRVCRRRQPVRTSSSRRATALDGARNDVVGDGGGWRDPRRSDAEGGLRDDDEEPSGEALPLGASAVGRREVGILRA